MNARSAILSSAKDVMKWIDRIIVILIFSIITLLILALKRESLFTLLFCIVILIPFGLLTVSFREWLNSRIVTQKTQHLARVLRRASKELMEIPSNIPMYDTVLSMEMSFVFDDIFDPFLAATARLMFQARLVFSEHTIDNWRNPETNGDVPTSHVIGKNVNAIANAVEARDYVRTFALLGEIFAYALLNSSNSKDDSFTSDDFVNLLRNITYALEQERILDGQNEIQVFIQKLANSPINIILDEQKWQVLIIYWLGIQINRLFDNPDSAVGRFRWLWAEQSDVLARKLRVIIHSYSAGDFVTVAEMINDSFDWKKQTPWFFLAPTR